MMNDQALEMLEYPALRELLTGLARTTLGRKRCEGLKPLGDRAAMETQLAGVRECHQLQERGLGWSFAPLEDPREWFSILRISGTTLEPLALLGLAGLCQQALEARRQIHAEQESCPVLWDVVEALPTSLAGIVKRIRTTILPGGEVDERASPELIRLNKSIERLRRTLMQTLEKVMRRSGVAIQEELVTLRNERFVIPVKADYRGRVQGVAHAASSSGATVFLEPLEAIEPNNQLQEMLGAKEREIARILRDLTEGLRLEADGCRMAAEVVAGLDFIHAKTVFLQRFRCTIPTISPDDTLELVEARHPLLEEHLRATREEVVPVSLRLDSDCPAMVISGANAGGKTVILKTAGLLSLMALSGLPVPARAARIPCYATLLADIGDHQSIAANLSTFTSHVANVSSMMEQCQSPALVLLDEVGTGTDPEEGSALGVAIVDYFRRGLGAQVIASTHYRGLKIYATNQEGVANASVSFDEKTFQPTYRLMVGQAGASSGIEIARRFGMPEEVTRRATAAVDETSREMNRYLRQIKNESEQLEAIRTALAEERQAVAEKYASLDAEALQREKKRGRRFEKELQSTIRNFEAQALKLVQEIQDQNLRRSTEHRVRTQSRKMEREARETARAASLEQARSLESDEALQEEVSPKKQPDEAFRVITDRPIEVGDSVRVKVLNKTGRVEKIEGGAVEVRLGSMRLRQDRSQLELVALSHHGQERGKAPAAGTAPSVMVSRSEGSGVGSELKLIGKTTEQAVEELDRYLDQAFLDGQSRLRIVHGHGTGALRRAVRDHLQGHPHVAGFETAPREEGGEGATVVELLT